MELNKETIDYNVYQFCDELVMKAQEVANYANACDDELAGDAQARLDLAVSYLRFTGLMDGLRMLVRDLVCSAASEWDD